MYIIKKPHAYAYSYQLIINKYSYIAFIPGQHITSYQIINCSFLWTINKIAYILWKHIKISLEQNIMKHHKPLKGNKKQTSLWCLVNNHATLFNLQYLKSTQLIWHEIKKIKTKGNVKQFLTVGKLKSSGNK